MVAHASWTSPLQHPYLARPNLKRKHSYYSQDSSSEPSPHSAVSDLPSAVAFPFGPFPNSLVVNPDYELQASEFNMPPKRRRCDTLEHDFEELSLEQIQFEREQKEREERERIERLWELDGEVDVDDVIRPTSVDSPIDEMDVQGLARGRNWFEPEKDRIIITSLDSDSDGSPKFPSPPLDPDHPQNESLVSRVVLQSLKTPASVTLFDPRRWGDLTPLERLTAGMTNDFTMNTDQLSGGGQEDDAMDIEF